MLDAPGPWGTGPFKLVQGYSSIKNVQSVIRKTPYSSTWFTIEEERSPLVVLEANEQYWNKKKRPRLKNVIFRNDLTVEQALDLCMNREGEVDIVSKITPEMAQLVRGSRYAKLVNDGGNRIIAGTFNRYLDDIDFNNRKLRLAINLAVNRNELINQAFYGYAEPLSALTPSWAFDYPEGLKPIDYHPSLARQLLKEAQWPNDRALRIAAPKKLGKVVNLLASQLKEALKIDVSVKLILPNEELRWKRVVAEKRLVPNWDILIADPYALFYEGTPAYFHRELLGADGALRAGPILPEFEQLFKEMGSEIDKNELLEKAEDVDRYVYDEALALFLFAPHALYAVNKHVDFKPYRTSLELLDTEVNEHHWSRP
ncbi:ABC transporter substrate-binding protein [Litchfieldia salsa]|uniref:Peptide/nickel transport system substrate-binding protein n=1 Tax=Litchfieldia salsa TaxID=930152 RepID=A0A1H0UAH2_9BACI|nr:peptide/nickel transport system substrate-binding protein [Litchfieldia salsa]